MCRHKIYWILTINKNVPCFVLLITGFILKRTKPLRCLKSFQTQKCITLSLFKAAMHNQCWLLLAGASLSQKLYIFFLLFVLHFSALYNRILDMLLSLEL